MTQPEKILAYLNDRKNSMPESPDLTDVIDKLRDNPKEYIAFYKEILMYIRPKMQSIGYEPEDSADIDRDINIKIINDERDLEEY